MEEKVPGGKRARLRISGECRHKVTLSGDFFIYPEEGISIIEDTLSGLDGRAPFEEVVTSLTRATNDNGIELVGLDVNVIARLYQGAMHVESHRP